MLVALLGAGLALLGAAGAETAAGTPGMAVATVAAGMLGADMGDTDVRSSARRDVLVWEAGDAVGGRIRTDIIDGFRCDRGFQVLNPAYPELRKAVDLSALGLQPFDAGIVVRREEGSAAWVHPLRDPGRVPAMLASGGFIPRDLLAVGRWAAPALRPKTLKAQRRPDRSLGEALSRAGVRGELRTVIDRW